MPAEAAGDANCGGTQRWPVKVGTDATASQVDLGSVRPATIASMLALRAPPKRPVDQRADATERTVFTIDAFLVQYNREDDEDYHLVIQDASRVRMIVEIPNPVCTKGKSSRFTNQIRAARTAFDQKFASVTTTAKQAGGVPLRVTGLGFFDIKRHGTGGADNGIELHPVLGIEFTPAANAPPVVTAATSSAQLARDGGFESGPSGSPWRSSTDVITNAKDQRAHSGSYYAWLGGYGEVHTDALSQQVTLPMSASAITLSYWLRIDTDEKTSRGSHEQDEAFDTLTVEVRGEGGASEEVADYSNLNAGGYTQATVDLSTYKGQTVTIVFTAREDRSKITSFFLDDVRVDVQ